MSDPRAGIDLFWLPLGAGGHSVRLNGIVFEAVSAQLRHRPRCDLYHAALEVRVPVARYVIEMTPIRSIDATGREAVATGAVGARWAGRLRVFRYEVVRWRDGVIPDVTEAIDSPRHLTSDPEIAQRVLDLVPLVPTPVWGRDEIAAGDMWNSNSLVSWLLASTGLDAASITPPAGGRAPGWHAGLVMAGQASADGCVRGATAPATGPPRHTGCRRRTRRRYCARTARVPLKRVSQLASA